MERGFLNRAAKAKARARQSLERRQVASTSNSNEGNGGIDAGQGEQVSNTGGSAHSGIVPVSGTGATVGYKCVAFQERVQLSDRHPLDGGWTTRFGAPVLLGSTPEWRPNTLSDLNLQLFCTWAKHFPDAADRVRPGLHIVVHLAAECPFSVQDLGTPGNLREVHCEERDCVRCRGGQGGYRFWWVSSRWTPCLAVDNGEAVNPNQRRMLCSRAAFPFGSAVPPNGDLFFE